MSIVSKMEAAGFIALLHGPLKSYETPRQVRVTGAIHLARRDGTVRAVQREDGGGSYVMVTLQNEGAVLHPHLSLEQARDLRDALDDALDEEDTIAALDRESAALAH